MTGARIAIVVILGVVAMMVITAAIHLIAPYVAFFVVILLIGWLTKKEKPRSD